MQKSEIQFVKDGFIGERMVYMPGTVKKHVLQDSRVRDLYITHIGIFPKALGHLRKRPLGCSQYILIYSVEGGGWIETNGRLHQLSANQLFVIPPKTPCSYGSDIRSPWTNYWIHFTGKNAEAFSPPINRVIDIPPSDDARIGERLQLFEDMMTQSEQYFNVERVVYANICLKLFLSSVRYLGIYRSVRTETGNETIDKLIYYMKCSTHRPVRMNDLAKDFDCSPSKLYKLFHQHMGISPQVYFLHLKMEKARKYLSQTNMKIKEIAARLGYEDPYHFSRIFSKHNGLSPVGYRKEERS